ncbi:gliding motility lipoprotein GldD [Myroides sp. LJL115]
MYKTILLPLLSILTLSLSSCKKEVLPKPQAYLALDYPKATYHGFKDSINGFSFQKNDLALIKKPYPNSLEVHYPQMKATIFLNYKPINNNLDFLLKDAQKLTYEHFIKADQIIEHPFEIPENNLSGILYQIEGNAATNVQFYATDSQKNFLVASLYFYAKPNFDSIYPAKEYLHNDMVNILESLQWNN